MNINQRLIWEYEKRCRKIFNDIVSFIDKLFVGDFKVPTEDDALWFFMKSLNPDLPTWDYQINRTQIESYIKTHCNAGYYGLLTPKIRELKLRDRNEGRE